MVRIDRRTGTRVFDEEPTDDPLTPVIWEAFKPDTEPRRTQRQDEIDSLRELVLAELRRIEEGPKTGSDKQPENFAAEQGGIY
jgi:penicillin-binding protein 1A